MKNHNIEKVDPQAADMDSIRCFVMDMDGTIYLGDTVIDGAYELIEYFQQQGTSFYFFTNNSSRAPQDYVHKLQDMGFDGITREHIMTSGDVMIHYLKQQKNNPKVYLAGTPELGQQFEEAGITLLGTDTQTADFAVLAFDTTFHFEKADTICRLVSDGVPFVATNIDRVCPLEGERYWPDCGSMAQMITHASGVAPKFVGKPFAETVDYILSKTGEDKQHVAMIGDRLYTDIKTALNGGITGIAVLSGEITYDDIQKSDVQPHYIINSVADLYRTLTT